MSEPHAEVNREEDRWDLHTAGKRSAFEKGKNTQHTLSLKAQGIRVERQRQGEAILMLRNEKGRERTEDDEDKAQRSQRSFLPASSHPFTLETKWLLPSFPSFFRSSSPFWLAAFQYESEFWKIHTFISYFVPKRGGKKCRKLRK